jgi:hypothetical protein
MKKAVVMGSNFKTGFIKVEFYKIFRRGYT